jgi:hypothetical protein
LTLYFYVHIKVIYIKKLLIFYLDLRNETEDVTKVVQPILMKNKVPARETDKDDGINDIDIRPDQVQ